MPKQNGNIDKPKHAGGRPTDYRQEYCETIQALGTKGYSLVEMAAELGCTKQTMFNWRDEHPEFLAALEKARTKSQAYWESLGRTHIVEDKDGPKINASLYSRSMAARFPDDWRDNSSVEVTGKNGGAIETKEISLEDTARKIAFILSAATLAKKE